MGTIRYPWEHPPANGDVTKIAEDVMWLRLPLPMALDHVNIYILDDGNKNFSVLDRSIKLIKIYFKLYKKGVGLFFARSSLTSAFPLLVANRFLNLNRAKIIFWSCGQDIVPLSYSPNPKNIKRFLSKIIVILLLKMQMTWKLEKLLG